MDFISKVPTFFKSMQKGKLIRLSIFAALVIIVAVVAATLLNQKTYSVLYSGMDTQDAGEVMQVLSEMGVDAKPRGDDTIMVETEQVDSIRMQMAAQGYPNSGFNFDIFQNASGLGATDKDKEIYYQFQMQENLRQTIIKLDKVEDAVVNLNLSEESSFVLSDDNKPATAAVMLMLKAGSTINNGEVRAIAELVSKSISGLDIEDVRIIDSQMNLYSLEEKTEMQNLNSQIDLQSSVQDRLKEQVINLLTPVFGDGNVIAEVSVILDFDKQVTESVVFTPPVESSGIVVSMKELYETIKNGEDGDVVGIDANGGAPTYVTEDENEAVYEKVSKESNMEVNETKTMIENSPGTIKDLSVSVILDSSTSTADYTDKVRQLVSNAIGVNPEKITVEMMPFKKMENTEVQTAFMNQKEALASMQKAEIIKYLIIGFAAVLILILISAIIRSVTGGPQEYEEIEEYEDYEIQSDDELLQAVNAAQAEEVAAEVELNFEKKDTSLEQLGKYVNRSPEAVAQLLKKWLYEDYGR